MLLAVYYRVMEHVGSLESTQEARSLWFQIELALRACSILKSRVWFQPKLHSTLFNYHYKHSKRNSISTRAHVLFSIKLWYFTRISSLRKNRNSTGEKLRRFFTCEIFFKGLPSLEKLPVRRVQVVVFRIYKIYLTLFVVFISCYGSLVRSFVPQELPSGL